MSLEKETSEELTPDLQKESTDEVKTNNDQTTVQDKKASEDKKPGFLQKIKHLQENMANALNESDAEPSLETNKVLDELIEKTEKEIAETAPKTTSEASSNEVADAKDEMISTCEALRDLKNHLISAPTPLLKKDYVLVHRNETLALVETLVNLCNEEPFDYAMLGDGLLNKLSGSGNEKEKTCNEPLSLVKQRVQFILNDAMAQADLIINDAKILSHQLLSNTEKKIQSRYDEAEAEINARMALTREESNKKLTEAKDSLTSARMQSEEILKKYLDKAEDDYQGYWERAEKHLEASHEKSLSILNKAVEIYQKELTAIKEDMASLNNILEELALTRPPKK